eukprot:470962-Pyramimonas_sp.AAC.1
MNSQALICVRRGLKLTRVANDSKCMASRISARLKRRMSENAKFNLMVKYLLGRAVDWALLSSHSVIATWTMRHM